MDLQRLISIQCKSIYIMVSRIKEKIIFFSSVWLILLKRYANYVRIDLHTKDKKPSRNEVKRNEKKN